MTTFTTATFIFSSDEFSLNSSKIGGKKEGKKGNINTVISKQGGGGTYHGNGSDY